MNPEALPAGGGQSMLGQAVTALLMLVACLGLYHIVFRRLETHGRLGLVQDRLRYLGLGLVFLTPAWWVVHNFPEWGYLQDPVNGLLIYIGVMAVIEVVLVLLLEGPRGPRVARSLQTLLRAFLYGILALAPISVMLGLPVFDPTFQAQLGSILVVYLALHLSYTYVFKWMPWRHALAIALRDRLRGWVYATLVAVVVYYAVTSLQILPAEGSTVEDYLRAGLGVFAGVLVFEAVLVCAFDYYFPVVRGSDVPSLFRDLARGLGYIAILALSTVYFLHREVGDLLLGSAVISVAVGFALQETLGNFFAGLALRLARPYTLGDRVEVFSFSGVVDKIDWRSTALATNQGDLLIVPNSKLAQEPLINHSAPLQRTGRYIEVGVHYRHPPNVVKRVLLEAAFSVPEVLEVPRPEVYLMSFGDSSMNYRLRVFIADFAERYRVDSKIREAIWYRFAREDLEIPFPIRNVYYLKPETGVDLGGEVRNLLDTVDFFSALASEDLALLTRRAQYQRYAAGEKICVQGEPGDSFYVIKNGRLKVTAVDSMGETFLSAEMLAGQYFGEMALLTGEPRSATVAAITDAELIRLGKEDLRLIMKGNTEVEQVISKVLAQRKWKTAKARIEAEEERSSRAVTQADKGDAVEQLTEQFLRKIREFFSY